MKIYRCIWCNRELPIPGVHECPNVPPEYRR